MRRALLLIMLFSLGACQKQTSSNCSPQDHSLSAKFNFKVGTVAEPFQLQANSPYLELVISQFNALSPENVMKANAIHPQEGVFDWYPSDQLVDFANDQNMRMHGHTLIWHQQLPEWISNFEGTKEEWRQVLKIHIQTIVARYKGRVAAWDVVNEAFTEDGNLRNSVWFQHLGAAYLRLAFEYAHEADPDALLFYNDYNLAQNPLKRNAAIRFCSDLKKAGVPIHGIGCQFHVSIDFPSHREMDACMRAVCEADFLLHISELDIALNPLSRSMPVPSEEDLQKQANLYYWIFKNYRRLPEAYQYGITLWGIGDADSWIPYFFNRDDYPLLFDENYQAKAAYCKLIEDL
ncbi:MAG: endo-1,4-beta-xylanase [Bacteroidetes bacterium]|nr:endo-1,4-beta-xylanase [Bacteroidota bacterium]